MKIFKNSIFTFVLGIILSSGVIYAYTISANNVSYDNSSSGINSNNVQGAIDELYNKANNTTIPANYKELSTVTTATIDDITIGKTAYNNNGELITGNSNKIYTEDQYQEYGVLRYNVGRIDGNSMYADASGKYISNEAGQVTINLGFKPRILIVNLENTNNNTSTAILYYNANRSTTSAYSFTYNDQQEHENVFNSNNTGMHIYNITNNGFIFNFSRGERVIYYSAFE